MELLSEFTSWTGYAGYLVAENVVDERRASKNLRRVSDTYTIKLKAKTVAETKALVALVPEFQDAEDALDEVQNYADLLKSVYTHLESCGKAISRELTRRTSRNILDDRNGKYNA